jgi:glycine cleavage system transcriptional repressor
MGAAGRFGRVWRREAAYLRRVTHFAVSAVGRDRPGIVAGITSALLDLEGNVEDSRMTILRGRFAVMLIVSVPGEGQRPELERRLAPVRERLELDALTVSEVAEAAAPETAPSHVITVYGADHPGIVHAVSAALAEHEVNITDLQTKLAGSGASPLYVMMMEVELGTVAPATLERALAEVGERADVEVSIRELDSEAL